MTLDVTAWKSPRTYIGKDIRPVEVMCWADTQVKPIDAEDHAIGLVKYENGAIGQFEVSWTFRGGLDLRDEVMGTEGTIWTNTFSAEPNYSSIFSTILPLFLLFKMTFLAP